MADSELLNRVLLSTDVTAVSTTRDALRQNRNLNLDCLRGVAVLLVVFYHVGIPGFVTGGWIGVDLFFVLSGFLISGLLFRDWLQTGSIAIKRFYIRRAFKIWPGFYALIGVTIALDVFFPGIPTHPITWRSILTEVTFMQDYFINIWGQTWSLAVEEQFYLILPAILLLLSRRRGEKPFSSLPTICAVIAIGALAMRILFTWNLDTVKLTVRQLCPVHLRLDSLMFGVLLSYYFYFEPDRFAQYARDRAGLYLLILTLAMASVISILNPVMHTFGYTLLYMAFGVLLCRVLNRPFPRFLRPLSWLGYYSYSIYLWHGWACRLIPRTSALTYLITVVAAIAPGILMCHLVEVPALRLRDRWFPNVKTARRTVG